jgi:hypothetical protein
MSATVKQVRKLTEIDFVILGILALLVFLGAQAFAGAVLTDTLFASARPDGPSLEELSPYPVVEDGVQRAYVDTAFGFRPQTIMAESGMPLEIEFGPAEEGGCYEAIYFPLFEDVGEITLVDGAVVELGELEPGQYEWACWMDMAYGLIVVE